MKLHCGLVVTLTLLCGCGDLREPAGAVDVAYRTFLDCMTAHSWTRGVAPVGAPAASAMPGTEAGGGAASPG